MELYAGLDLHSRNTYIGIMDKAFNRVVKKRVPNHLEHILQTLDPFRDQIKGFVVEWQFLHFGVFRQRPGIKSQDSGTWCQGSDLLNSYLRGIGFEFHRAGSLTFTLFKSSEGGLPKAVFNRARTTTDVYLFSPAIKSGTKQIMSSLREFYILNIREQRN